MTRARWVGAALVVGLLLALLVWRRDPDVVAAPSEPIVAASPPAAAVDSRGAEGQGAVPPTAASVQNGASVGRAAPEALADPQPGSVLRPESAPIVVGPTASDTPTAGPSPSPTPTSPEVAPPTEDDVVQRFRDTYGEPDPEHARRMIAARRERSLEVVEGLMAGLAQQEEEEARRAGDTERATKLAASLHRLEWRHQVLDRPTAEP